MQKTRILSGTFKLKVTGWNAVTNQERDTVHLQHIDDAMAMLTLDSFALPLIWGSALGSAMLS